MEVVICPICTGQGLVSRPPWVAGDQLQWVATTTTIYQCRACGGKGYLILGAVWDGDKKINWKFQSPEKLRME